MSGPFDARIPPQMAEKAAAIGVSKAEQTPLNLLALGILAGAFIALGAMFSTLAITECAAVVPYGLTRVLAGITFSLGLILVVVAGAELFTGNNLIVMAWASGRIRAGSMLRNWAWVYLGNLVGAVLTAALVVVTGHLGSSDGAVGELAGEIAAAKCQIGFMAAFTRGVLGNGLVCLAVWLTFSARTTSDKILAVVLPITAFVACGFEHCVANMYFVPLVMISPNTPEAVDLSSFVLGNLLPVTLGNIVGGAGLVGLIYWFIYQRRQT